MRMVQVDRGLVVMVQARYASMGLCDTDRLVWILWNPLDTTNRRVAEDDCYVEIDSVKGLRMGLLIVLGLGLATERVRTMCLRSVSKRVHIHTSWTRKTLANVMDHFI